MLPPAALRSGPAWQRCEGAARHTALHNVLYMPAGCSANGVIHGRRTLGALGGTMLGSAYHCMFHWHAHTAQSNRSACTETFHVNQMEAGPAHSDG